jgi:hypothetical protein
MSKFLRRGEGGGMSHEDRLEEMLKINALRKVLIVEAGIPRK